MEQLQLFNINLELGWWVSAMVSALAAHSDDLGSNLHDEGLIRIMVTFIFI